MISDSDEEFHDAPFEKTVFDLAYEVPLLSRAAEMEDLELVKELLENKRHDPGIPDNRGWSFLHYAAASLNAPIIKYFLLKFCSVSQAKRYMLAATWKGDTPLSIACQNPNVTYEVVDLLLTGNVNLILIKNEDKLCPFDHLLMHNNLDALRYILQKHKDFFCNKAGKFGDIFYKICHIMNVDIFKILLEEYPVNILEKKIGWMIKIASVFDDMTFLQQYIPFLDQVKSLLTDRLLQKLESEVPDFIYMIVLEGKLKQLKYFLTWWRYDLPEKLTGGYMDRLLFETTEKPEAFEILLDHYYKFLTEMKVSPSYTKTASPLKEGYTVTSWALVMNDNDMTGKVFFHHNIFPLLYAVESGTVHADFFKWFRYEGENAIPQAKNTYRLFTYFIVRGQHPSDFVYKVLTYLRPVPYGKEVVAALFKKMRFYIKRDLYRLLFVNNDVTVQEITGEYSIPVPSLQVLCRESLRTMIGNRFSPREAYNTVLYANWPQAVKDFILLQ